MKVEETTIPIIVFDREVEDKVLSDPVYRYVIKAMETRIKSHRDWRTFEFHFSWERDVELPEWQKTIITVKLGDTGFDEKMDLWDMIDAEIRQAIEEAKNRSPNFKNQVEMINKTLFTSVEL